jgi:hypothetical protein
MFEPMQPHRLPDRIDSQGERMETTSSNIKMMNREELMEYAQWLIAEVENKLSPEEVCLSGMTWGDYNDLRKYQMRRLLEVNERLVQP